MLHPATLDEQLDAAARDPLRVLVAGAGVAGLALVQLLRRRGLHPVLVERAGPGAPDGYMLALMPLADPLFAGLELTAAYRARSTPLRRYDIRGRRGGTVRRYDMTRVLGRYGDYRGISRGALLDVLAAPGGTVTHGAAVTAVEHAGDTGGAGGAERVTLAAGERAVTAGFDLVVAADGLHSGTRALVLGPGEVAAYDTGWAGWVTWSALDDDRDLGWELWGPGLFVGTYPVEDRLGVIVCGPADEIRRGPEPLTARVRRAATRADARLERVLRDVEGNAERYFWPLTDCRSATWSAGRTVLLGDAAAGFLPTAGIGAGMAMESAWVLAAHLADAGAGDVPERLRAYERAQRPRVEAAQENSRTLARLMFRGSPAFAALREAAARVVPIRAALRPIRGLLEHRPPVPARLPGA